MRTRLPARAFAGAAVFSVAVGGCSGDGTAPARRDAACEGDQRAIRLWGLNLSHPDTVDLKNPSDCAVELAGLELFFDDRDDAFGEGTIIDCTLRLPELVLPAGASVRVSELPMRGEIDALAAEVGGCAYPLTFNPDRGGATYLCEGPCRLGSVIDVLAHQGDDIDAVEPGVVLNRYRDPPALLFGARFPHPVRGASKFNDQLVRYQRVATAGRYPDFVVDDWALQSRTLFSDFEDGINVREVASAPEPWGLVEGEPAEIRIAGETARSGSASLRITHLGSDGATDGLGRPLDARSVPRDLEYFVRAGPDGATAGELSLLAQSTPAIEVGFGPEGLGVSQPRGRRAELSAEPDTWYRVELRDIDWERGAFDFYVDGSLVGKKLALLGGARVPDELRLFGTSAGSTTYFDWLRVWGPPYAIDVPEGADGADGANACAITDIPTDGAGDGPTCGDIDGPNAVGATCASFCADWATRCCGESFASNYANETECLADCATFSVENLCCRAREMSVGGPERCRFALGVGDALPASCSD